MKIFHKIFLGTVFAAVLPLAISGWWTIKLIRKENNQRITSMLSSSAQNLADAVFRYIAANVNSVKASLKNFSPEKKYMLKQIVSSFENVEFIGVDGHYFGDASFLKIGEKKEGIFFLGDSVLFLSPDVKVALSSEPIMKIVYSFSLGKTGKAFVKKISSEKDSEILELEEDGKKFVASYYRVPNSDFAVFVSVEKKEIEKIWLNILYQVLFWIGVGVILAFSSSFVISRGLAKPLQKIAETASEYAKLDFSKKLEYKGKDEISDVVKAFSVMSDEIERAWEEINMWNRELEKRVEERTLQLKKAHDNLLIAEKIASVGTLGAGVAHEINNPLAASLGFIQILKRKIQDEQLKKYFDSIFNNLTRIRGIVERLRNFSEVQMKTEYNPVNVNEVIKKVVEDIQNIKGEKTISLNLQPVQEIYSNEEHIGTAIYEILKNAIFASKEKIEIRTYQDSKNVFIEIEDDGEEGIPKEMLTRIFEPFFTLKKWEGAGLGLTIARTIIQNIRGTIEVDSSPGKTVFKIIIDIDKNRELVEFLKEEVDKIKAHLV